MAKYAFTRTDFLRESNMIEGIHRDPTREEHAALETFLMLPRVTVLSLCDLVSVFAPHNCIRDQPNLNVRVGDHIAPRGGPDIPKALEAILRDRRSPWDQHIAYETLHPFMDGNGRSGRALWLWSMGGLDAAPLGFLHTYYYQTLSMVRRRA